MGTNILVYPVILSKNGDGYFVTVPDFTINTEGKNIADAIAMDRDAIGLNVLQLEANNVTVPEPYSQYFQVQDDDILTLVDIDITDYRNKYENRTVKKNCTIPYRVNNPNLQQQLLRSELVKAHVDQPKFFENYVVYVITPTNDTLVCSSVQAL